MVWGAIGWGQKSKLVFLERPEKGGICSRHYRDQVLIPVVNEFMQDAPDGTIYMEDGAKIHLGDAKKWKAMHFNYPTFYLEWPPNSPDLNLIEKVWRWIKQELTKLEPYPLAIEDLKEAVQTLWDQLDPTTWMIKEIEAMPERLKAVIANRGLATKYQ